MTKLSVLKEYFYIKFNDQQIASLH